MAEVLNEKSKLPKYILIMLDTDIIQSVDTKFGVKLTLCKILTWLMDEILRFINIRKEDIRSKKPGALASSAEPRIVWCSILQRPRNTNPEMHRIFKLVGKTNEIIEQIVRSNDQCSHMLYVESIDQYVHFDYQGKLTGLGRTQFWKEIDAQMRKLERGETDLLPRLHGKDDDDDSQRRRSKDRDEYRHKGRSDDYRKYHQPRGKYYQDNQRSYHRSHHRSNSDRR